MLVIKCHLKRLLDERGMTQKDLHQLSGVREATIGDMCKNENKMFSREALAQIAIALDITDIRQLLTIENDEKPTE